MNQIVEWVIRETAEPVSIDFDGENLDYARAKEIVDALVQLPGSYIQVFNAHDQEIMRMRDQGAPAMQIMVPDDKFRNLPDRTLAANYLAHNGMTIRLHTGF